MVSNNCKSDERVLDELERTKWKRVGMNLLKDWRLYSLLIPVLVFIFLWRYMPIYGILSGFKKDPSSGNYATSEWAGLYFAKRLFSSGNESKFFWQAFRNTFVNSMYGLLFGFPIPIIIALLFSEIKIKFYCSFLQVCSYLPHFVSTVVVTTIIGLWCSKGQNVGTVKLEPGLLQKLFERLNWIREGEESGLKYIPRYFRPIYQVSGVWEGAGYGSIVYFAAVLAISPTNYEAAKVDGASKLQQIKYVTFPGMAPTLTIMLIMRVGRILQIGFEKVLLLYNTSTYETADVISTFVYRYAQGEGENTIKGVGIVADLFNSIIAMILVLGANSISRRVSSTALF